VSVRRRGRVRGDAGGSRPRRPLGGTFQAGGECNKALFGGSISLAARGYASPADCVSERAQETARPAAAIPLRPYTAGLVSQRPALGCLFEIVETLVLTLLIFVVIQNFIAQPYKVQQLSMERTLEPDQYVLVDKLTPRFDAYNRGDIVVFDPPADWGDTNTPFIKRVIGEPGDRIEIKDDGLVYVNGQPLDEPYLYLGEDGQPQSTTAPLDESTWTVPAGELFLMGDHRQNSADSRTFGPVPIDRVIGRAWLRYWPLGTFGVLQTPSYPNIIPATSAAP
jgi:signal peptidase I